MNQKLILEKINKIDKAQARLTVEKRDKTQITNTIRKEKGDITINSTYIKGIIRKCYEEIYVKNLTTQMKWKKI